MAESGPPEASGSERWPTDDLRRRTVRGGTITISSQGLTFLVFVVTQAILSRMLTPRDFGLIAMVTAVSGILGSGKHFGLNEAALQRRHIDDEVSSSLFWLNLTFGTAFGLLLALLSPIIAAYNDEPGLLYIGIAMAAVFPLTGLGVQPISLLQRRLRFGTVALTTFLGPVVGLAVGVVLARADLGYWALVARQLSMVLTISLCAWLFCRWRPRAVVAWGRVKDLVAFGGNVTLFRMTNGAVQNLDKVFLGAFCGEVVLGIYSKAYHLLMVPAQQFNQAVNVVALPTLNRLQDNPERLRLFYTTGLRLVAAVQLPIAGVGLVTAHHLIPVFLGVQWVASVPVFRWLVPVGLCSALNPAITWVTWTVGSPSRHRRFSMLEACVVVPAYFLAAPHGATTVAMTFGITLLALRIPAFLWCTAGTPVRARHALRALSRPAVATGCATVATLAVDRLLVADLAPPVALAVLVAVFAAVYPLAWVTLPGGRTSFRELRRLLGDLRRAPGAAPGPGPDTSGG